MGEAAMELEDDVFFADLSRQISLLIMDDDEEDDETSATHCTTSVSLEAFSRVMHPKIDASTALMYEQMMSRRESKGTGVFIPRSSHPTTRRNNRHYAKFSASKSQTRPSHNSSPPLFNSLHNKNLHTNTATHHPFNSTAFS